MVGEPTVKIKESVAHFSGVQNCGAIWTCPVCGPYIRHNRFLDVEHACSWWIDRNGDGSVLLLTLTLPHDQADSLDQVLAAVRHSFAALVAGKAWQTTKGRFKLKHYIRAHDCTHGPNGWHFHVHVLLFAELPLTPTELAALEALLHERWARAVTRRGFRLPSRSHGIDLQEARGSSDVARYICQIGTEGAQLTGKGVAVELTRGDLKRSKHAAYRTPWEILSSFANTGDMADLRLWRDWERETQRVKAIRWSNGLRALVSVADKGDEEIVAVEIGGTLVYEFKPGEWYWVSRTGGARARVLALAETVGGNAVEAYVATVVSDCTS